MKAPSEGFDVIVIGAGIAGASVAHFLAAHARVALVERESQPAYHSTGRSAALFAPSYGPPQVRALTRASRRFLDAVPALAARGALFIAQRPQLPALQALHDNLLAEGAAGTRWLDTRAAQALVPVLRDDAVAGALHDTDASDIDVHALHQHYLRSAAAQRIELVCDFDVTRVGWSQRRWEVEDGGKRCLHAPLVVNAAGAWAGAIGALAGARALGLQPRRRSAFTFAPPPGMDIRAWPEVGGIDEDFYFMPQGSGVLLGSPANADAVQPHDVVAEELDIATGIARIEEATTLTIRRPLRTWAGLRSFVPDGALVGGFDDALPGFFWCCGQGGYGIQTSAAMGELCAARVLGQPLPAYIADHGLSFDDLRCRR